MTDAPFPDSFHTKVPGRFVDAVDNTFREAAAVCQMKARYRHIMDLAPVGQSVHLHAGGAYAAGVEAVRRAYYERGLDPEAALAEGVAALGAFYGDFSPPPSSYKSRVAMEHALRYTFRHAWPLATDSYRPRRMEWRFKVPIPGLVHPDHGGPIYYTGRPDTLGDVNELEVIHDDKTAGSLGESWLRQWELDSQFTGYQWAGEELGLLKPGGSGAVLVRGLSILAPKIKLPGALDKDRGEKMRVQREWLATGVLPEGATYDIEGSFGHAQVIVYRPRWVVERWLAQLQRDVKRLIHAYLNDEWDYALHKGACNAYGGCPFSLLCSSEHPEQWIDGNYEVKQWDPMSP